MTIFLISDTHFSHDNIRKYCGRPFTSVTQMDEFMVEAWNQTVRPQDHVYHLGDVAMRQQHLEIVKRLNGHKRLVRGNHDIFKTKLYLAAGFAEIHGVRVLDNLAMTHIPIHPESLGRYFGNVHGHIHEKDSPAGPYLNVSVEKIGYRPISLEEAKARIDAKRKAEGYVRTPYQEEVSA